MDKHLDILKQLWIQYWNHNSYTGKWKKEPLHQQQQYIIWYIHDYLKD